MTMNELSMKQNDAHECIGSVDYRQPRFVPAGEPVAANEPSSPPLHRWGRGRSAFGRRIAVLEHFHQSCSAVPGHLRCGLFGLGLRFGSVTGFFKPAPSPKPRPSPKILAAQRYIFSVNALVLFLIAGGLRTAQGQGQLLKEETVSSHFLEGKRAFRVYLPASYRTNLTARYPVLYLNDGQNMFSSAGMDIAAGWGNWALDRTVDELTRDKKMAEIILVAVDNSRTRFVEYNGRANSTNGVTPFENYAEFLMEELKPRIDGEYRTKPDAAHTGIMGSSLGGICSLALAWEHPDVFGRAACLSGAFEVDQTNFVTRVLGGYRGKPKPFRFYLDSGTSDFAGGDDDDALTQEVYKQMRRIGWKRRDLRHFTDDHPLTLKELRKSGIRHDKWVEAQTSQHNELYWRLRAWRALTFLFPADGK
jgi:enterochelin esterase-like enzyme